MHSAYAFHCIEGLPAGEDRKSQQHQRRREEEGDLIAPVVADPWHHKRRGGRTDIHRSVEHREGVAAEPLLPRTPLVVGHAHQGGNIRLNDPRTHRQQPQGCAQKHGVLEPQNHVPQDIGQREAHDRPVLAEDVVGQPSADQRQQIAAGNEVRHHAAGQVVRESQPLGHVQQQNRPHPVIRAAFRELAPEDEPKTQRMVQKRAAFGARSSGRQCSGRCHSRT